jgi:acetate---CoA ligase (ADP-forming)
MPKSDLKGFFTPKSIALFGASKDPRKVGGKTLTNLLTFNNGVKIYPINPGYDEVMGIRCYPNLSSISSNVDFAIIAVAGKKILDAVQQCVNHGVKYAVIFTSGFAEIGEEGKRLQDEIIRLSREQGLRFVGPNTMGCMNYIDKIPLSFGRIGKYHLQGTTGLISQSGAMGNILTEHAMDEKVGFSYFASVGNQADIDIVELMEFMVHDEGTNVISVYMESVKNAKKMKIIAAEALQKHKPIVLLKSGRSSIGQKAALSHTASMTGSDAAFRAFAKQYGIVQVKDVSELVNALKTFNRGKRTKGKNVAVISTSGASCILFADNCSDLGLELVSFNKETEQKLKEIMPDFGSVQNPLDVTGAALTDKTLFKNCLEIISSDDNVDALIVDTNFGYELGMKMAKEIVEIDQKTEKPILVCYTSGEAVEEARNYLKAEKIPTYASQLQTTESMKMLMDYENQYELNHIENSNERLDEFAGLDLVKVHDSKLLTEPKVKGILSQLNITIPKGNLATSVNHALQIADRLSYPLVAKVASVSIPHKSDVGGVIFPIKDKGELIEAYNTIIKNVSEKVTTASIDGILIEEMIQGPFIETIVGVKNDPDFGPIILFGLGGIYVEVLKDVSQSLAPVTEQQALQMIRNLKSFPILTGARSGIQYDISALAKVLVNLSHFAMTVEESILEMEINPLIVLPKGEGVVALDGLFTLKQEVEEDTSVIQ